MSYSSTPYNADFHINHASGSLSSARAIAPLVIDLVKPRSVVDIGCGIGTWLRAFADLGIEDYIGLDGEYVNQSDLLIPADRFRAAELTKPPSLEQKFDLAVCLEVAEHLPQTVANRFVDYLTTAAPVVLFSAALPGQRGTNHINEQWPSYWRQRFENRGYIRLDPIRPQVWRDNRVKWWYKQNIYLYATTAAVAANSRLKEEEVLAREFPFELIYSDVFSQLIQSTTVRGIASALPNALIKAIRRATL